MGDGQPVRIRVQVEGLAPGAAHGSHIDSDGTGIVSVHRMYQLIRQPEHTDDQEIEILFLPGDR
jgi:hypothetical protein